MANISFHGSHNTGIAIEVDGKINLILELERYVNLKNAGIAQYNPVPGFLLVMDDVARWILKTTGIDMFDTCYASCPNVVIGTPTDGYRVVDLSAKLPATEYVWPHHHLSHAGGCFYQSSFKEALIFSFDGGGDDGKFNVYHCVRGEVPTLLEIIFNPRQIGPGVANHQYAYYDLGFAYMILAHYLEDIRFEGLTEGNLVYPGKLMGLASYGTVREEWLPHFVHFMKGNADGASVNGETVYITLMRELGENIGVEFDPMNRLSGQLAWDLAATHQRAFEECFLEVAKPYFDQYPDLPICITGGCGLNIILNTRLVEEFKKDVFVGPNPSDCGLIVGMLANVLLPEEPIDVTYAGLPLLDIDTLMEYVAHYTLRHARRLVHGKHLLDGYTEITYDTLTQDLIDGKIVGVAMGQSEHGPRALGNRSILCNPAFASMKDTLNEKVKNREWYRPFAPVVRLEDVSKYFEWEGESRWMSFCPKVRPEWRDVLSAITHVDGTARVQTITREQHAWLYDLLTAMDAKTGVGVLLNTSFNVNGKPILSTLKDAFHIYENTELDGVVIENYYFRKEPFVVPFQ